MGEVLWVVSVNSETDGRLLKPPDTIYILPQSIIKSQMCTNSQIQMGTNTW